MVCKATMLVTAVALTAGLFGCAGPMGKGEGEQCATQDDCSTDLTCQPVSGRQGDYCCPTPADAGNSPNCLPAH